MRVTCKNQAFSFTYVWAVKKTNLMEDAFDNIKFITAYYNFLAFIKSPQSVKFWLDPSSLAKKKNHHEFK